MADSDEGYDEDYEEATPEQKLSIATYFIMSSPIGEADFVVADTKKLLGDNDTKKSDADKILSDDVLGGILGEYNTDHMIRAKIPDSKQMLLFSPQGKIPDSKSYLDPRGGVVYNVNHLSRTVDSKADSRCAVTDYEDLRKAIEKHVDKYLSTKYKAGVCASAVYVLEDGNVTVCISASNTKISSYWTGGWNSTFKIDCSTDGKHELTSNIKLHVHYFEDGNVQLHSAIEKKTLVKFADTEEKTAINIAKTIDNIETSFQDAMETMYKNIHRVTFKELRRFLPISKQPMEWSAFAHGVGL